MVFTGCRGCVMRKRHLSALCPRFLQIWQISMGVPRSVRVGTVRVCRGNWRRSLQLLAVCPSLKHSWHVSRHRFLFVCEFRFTYPLGLSRSSLISRSSLSTRSTSATVSSTLKSRDTRCSISGFKPLMKHLRMSCSTQSLCPELVFPVF